jgi:hypothetical protein
MHFHDFQRAHAIHMLAGSIRFKNAGEVIRRIARLRRKAAVENGKNGSYSGRKARQETSTIQAKQLILLAGVAGLEPATPGFGV